MVNQYVKRYQEKLSTNLQVDTSTYLRIYK